MINKDIYETPRRVQDLGDCNFYHTMDIPVYGKVEGEIDLRKNIHKYLGGVEFKGKRVLEIGTASGFCCFYMENKGAEVVAFDLSENHSWDIVPFSRYNHEQIVLDRKLGIKKIHNAFWLAHEAFGSKAKAVHGSCYTISEDIGMVDISIFGSILLHVRDPFLVLQQALRLTKETVIITEAISWRYIPLFILSKFIKSHMIFFPDFKKCKPLDSWWFLSPRIIKQLIGVLGFEKTETTYHYQWFRGRKLLFYTVVGHKK